MKSQFPREKVTVAHALTTGYVIETTVTNFLMTTKPGTRAKLRVCLKIPAF